MLTKPEDTYSDDLYRFAWPGGVEMILERFHESRDDIACELTVRSAHPTKGGTLVDGKRLLLIGPNSQRDMKRLLDGRDEEPDWGGMLEQATTLARRRYRRGEPPTDLRTPMDEVGARYLIHPLLISNGVTVWFGPEESAKSMIAMGAAICVASGGEVAGVVAEVTGPVVYLDWEDGANTHRERLRAICHGAGVRYEATPIWHVRMTASLKESARDIRRLIAEIGAVFVIVDSIGMACGGDPSEAGRIVEVMGAARSLGVPVLGIHHLPKDSRDKSRPYGSVYAAAEARMTWLIEKDEEAAVARGSLRVAMTNKKSNSSQRHDRVAFDLQFSSGDNREELLSVAITPLGFHDSVTIGTGAGQKWRIREVLDTPKDIATIATETGITRNSVRMQLNRHADMFVKKGDFWARIDTNHSESPDTGRIESVRASLEAPDTPDTDQTRGERDPDADPF